MVPNCRFDLFIEFLEAGGVRVSSFEVISGLSAASAGMLGIIFLILPCGMQVFDILFMIFLKAFSPL